VLALETWASVSDESWAAFLGARASGKPFEGTFAWSANALPGFEADPAPCNLVPGPPGHAPRLQPHAGHPLHAAQAKAIGQDKLAKILAASVQTAETRFGDAP